MDPTSIDRTKLRFWVYCFRQSLPNLGLEHRRNHSSSEHSRSTRESRRCPRRGCRPGLQAGQPMKTRFSCRTRSIGSAFCGRQREKKTQGAFISIPSRERFCIAINGKKLLGSPRHLLSELLWKDQLSVGTPPDQPALDFPQVADLQFHNHSAIVLRQELL